MPVVWAALPAAACSGGLSAFPVWLLLRSGAMTTPGARELQVNRHAVMGGVTGWLAMEARPAPGDYIGQYPLFAVLVMACLMGGALALRGFRNRYERRKLLAAAKRKTGTLGDARFASVLDLHDAGLTDPVSGHLLCLVKGVPIFAPPATHFCMAGPPGSGKSTASAVMFIVHLAMSGSSVYVTDIKPELSLLVGKELARRGFRVRYWNQAGLAGLAHTDENPFQVLVEEGADDKLKSRILTTADGFAFQITPEPDDDGKHRFFRDLERGLFVTLITALAMLDPAACIPSCLWAHLSDPKACEALLREAAASDVLYGDLAAMARGYLELIESNPEHYHGARQGLAQNLSMFRPSSDLGLMGTAHAVSAADMRDESSAPVIHFDIVPVDALETYGKAVALLQYARLSVLKRVAGRPVSFCLDEATNMPLRGLAKEITLLRSRKIVLALLYQSLSELKRVFGEKTAATITGNATEQFLQVSDLDTAEMISKRIGEHTVKTTGTSMGLKDGAASRSTSEHAKRLMPPDEVLNMGQDETLIFIPGMRPIRGQKVPFYHIDPVKHWPGDDAHETHPVSRITALAIHYAKSAHALVPPIIAGHKAKLKAALKKELGQAKPARVRLIERRSFLWAPILASFFWFVQMIGAPYLIYEYSTRPSASGQSQCVYMSWRGFEQRRVAGTCPLIAFFTKAEAAR